MKLRSLRISLIAMAVLVSLMIAVPVYALDPSMDVVVEVGNGTEVTVLGQSDTSLDANGMPVNNVIVNGDGVVYKTDFNNTNAFNASQITEYYHQIQNQKQIITQQAQTIADQKSSIEQTRIELTVVEQAIVKLINQSSLSSQDITKLNELISQQASLSSKLVNDITQLSSNYDILHRDFIQQESSVNNKITALENRIAELEQDKYNREHSGLRYTLGNFITSLKFWN